MPVHVDRDLSPEQMRAYRIADNQAAPIDAAGLIDSNAIPESRDPVDPIRDPPTQLLHRDP